MNRLFPALDIRFVPEAEAPQDLRDSLVAGLDDFQPTAIEETATRWRVFFGSPDDRDRALRWLRGLGDPRVGVQAIDVEDEDWARRSQADLRPVRVGRIIVTPPWWLDEARREAGVDDMLIVVVPSRGFGTGHHPSTRLCLGLLQDISVRGRSVLDIGTGSGVLALAAARMGASAVTAVDDDSDAIDAARENVALNGIDVPFRLERADFRTLRDARADIVIANLTGNLLRSAVADIVGCLNQPGDAIVSGVLEEERSMVVAAFESAGVRLQAAKAEDQWLGLCFTP